MRIVGASLIVICSAPLARTSRLSPCIHCSPGFFDGRLSLTILALMHCTVPCSLLLLVALCLEVSLGVLNVLAGAVLPSYHVHSYRKAAWDSITRFTPLATRKLRTSALEILGGRSSHWTLGWSTTMYSDRSCQYYPMINWLGLCSN